MSNSQQNSTSLFSISSAYASLFAISGVVIGVYVTQDISEKLNANAAVAGFSKPFIFLYIFIVFVSAIHQFNIYNGFHQIEADEAEWKQKTGGWAGSPLERFLRISTLFVILGAFAKGGPVIDLISLLSKIPCAGNFCFDVPDSVEWLQSINNAKYKTRIFLTLISVTFFMYIIWELAAIFCINLSDSSEEEKNDQRSEIIIWIISDFIALVIWVSMAWVFLLDSGVWIFVIPVVFMIVYFIIVAYRFLGLKSWKERMFPSPSHIEQPSSGA